MFDFGLLKPYIDDFKITDIMSNSKSIYVSHVDKGTYKIMDVATNGVKDLVNRLCNTPEINAQFNYEQPILDGEIEGLRIHATHESFSTSGTTLTIRKNPIDLVINEKLVSKGKYCPPIVYDFIKKCALAKMSVMFAGEVGSGKTQLMKTFLSFVPDNSTIVLLSDIDEMLLLELYPKRNIRQYIVNQIIDYNKATASILRDNADYVCFQEVRDTAVDDLFLVLSSSARVCASVHVKSALLMPQRLIQLSQASNDNHLLSTIHDYIQVCILPARRFVDGKLIRYIGEIAVFYTDDKQVACKQLIYESNGIKATFYDIPATFIKFFVKQDIYFEMKGWTNGNKKK